jgi:hypothetical protein
MNPLRQKYYEIWGNEQAQNSVLKGLLVGFGLLILIQTVALVFLSLRKPVLIALNSEETRVLSVRPPSEELLKQELKRTLTDYLQAHYTWNSKTVEASHLKASHYVSDRFTQSFIHANAEQVRVAKEKNLEERIYISNMDVDSKTLSARAFIDRILIVHSDAQPGGLRATQTWTLDVSFEYGPRTEQNSEGIYVTGERQVNP